MTWPSTGADNSRVILAEKTLRQEVIADLRHLQAIGLLKAVWVPMTTGAYLPRKERPGTLGARIENQLIATLFNRLKADGEMLIGAADFLLLWGTGSGVIELKREKQPDLFVRRPAGRRSQPQIDFGAACERIGVRYAVCPTLYDVRNTLMVWGRIVAPVERPPYRVTVSSRSRQ